MSQVILTQHAVGQGGLWSGEISADGEPIRWIYDCGSNQLDSLMREIKSFGSKKIDLFFLSHLDNDHVNGIDVLLCNCLIEEVILPYLEPANLLLILGTELAAGRLTEAFRSFIATPVVWLQARGVKKVTFIRSTRDDDDNPPSLPEGPVLLEQDFVEVDWNKPPRIIPWKWAKGGRLVTQGNILQTYAQTGSAIADWVFIPQVHLPTAERAKAFYKALKVEFPDDDLYKVAIHAISQDGRRKLRRAYDTLVKDHNKTTMSLYVGPRPSSQHSLDVVFNAYSKSDSSFQVYRRLKFHETRRVGWLTSGDADLSMLKRRKSFLRFYDPVLPEVRVFILPHHGSAESFDPSLLAAMPALQFGVAAAGPNGYGHPHKLVRDAVNKESMFIQVNERESSNFTCTITYSNLARVLP